MNVESALFILNLNNKYNINNILELNQNELKKAYHIMALEYHPDKNNSLNATYTFQKIQNAYNYLNNIINNSSKSPQEQEENNNLTYEELILNFINLLIKNYTTQNENYEDINNLKNHCIDYSYKIIENLLDKLNIDTLQEIYNILNKKILNNNNISNVKSIEIIKNILIKKLKNYNIIIINPILKNILNNEIYKLNINEINVNEKNEKNEENEENREIIYIPLWHNELNYFNNIIKIKPILNKNIIIDENNNIIKYYYHTFDYVINLIKNYDFPFIKIVIEDIELIIPIKELKMKKNQNYIFQNIGISKININDIFDTSKMANIIININLS